MDWLGDIEKVVAIVVGGLTIVTGAWLGIMKWWRRRVEERAAKEQWDWHGSIDVGRINTWFVRLVDEPDEPSATVVLEVIDADGRPDPDWARNIRQIISSDGRLSRSPTAEELAILKHLRLERGYGRGAELL